MKNQDRSVSDRLMKHPTIIITHQQSTNPEQLRAIMLRPMVWFTRKGYYHKAGGFEVYIGNKRRDLLVLFQRR